MTLFIVIILMADLSRATPARLRTVTVCEVLKGLNSYNGKMVAVRGEWVVGEEHNFLRAGDCSQKLITSGYVWPNAIHLVYPPSPQAQTPVGFRLDERAMRRVNRAIEKQAKEHGAGSVWITFVGKLETPESLQVADYGGGRLVPNGLGHLGGFPAQLIVRTARGVVVTARRTGSGKD